jgi:hypothetical protein
MNTATIAAPKAAELTFNVGDKTTCQFGNSFDTSGYCTDVPVEIIGVLDCKINLRRFYLVKKEGQDNFVGRAAIARNPRGSKPIKGVLYCTNARSFGKGTNGERFGFMSLEDAKLSLGFNDA